MKEGSLKTILYKTKIIPLYSSFLQWRYDKRNLPDRWYFRFLPIIKKKIVFDSLYGKGYGDDPKAIADVFLEQNDGWDIVWLANESKSIPNGIRFVKYGSIQAMRELATAKVWVFNARLVKHPKKRKNQLYLQTWHALFPFKYIEKESDNLSDYYKEEAKKDGGICDAILSGCSVMSEVMRNYFWLNPKTEILEYGIPTDDVFFNEDYKQVTKKKLREMYNINSDSIVILYMPTFRDDHSTECYNLDYERVINCFEKKFSKECIMLVRFHPNVDCELIDLPFDNRVINVSDYLVANDFLILSDFLISDYSGMIMSFAILDKPVFIFATDLEKYATTRGLNKHYFSLPFSKSKSNLELTKSIECYEKEDYIRKWLSYKRNIQFYDDGDASKKTVEWIKTTLNRES